MQIGISDLSRTVTATELSKSAFSQANTIMNFNGSNPFFGHIPGPPNGCHRVYQGMKNAMPNRAPPPYFFRQSSLPNDPAPMHHWGGGHGIMRLSRQWSSGYESHHRGLIPLGHHGHPSSHGFGRHGRFFHPYHVPTRLPNPIRNFAPGGYPRLSGNDNLQRFFNPIDRNVPGGFPAPTRHNLPSRFSNTNGHYGPIRSNHFSNHRGSSTTTRNNLSNEVHAQNEISNRQNAHITQRVGIGRHNQMNTHISDHRSRSFIPWKDQLGGKHQKRSSKESKLDASVEPAFSEEAPPKGTPKYVEPRDEEFEKSLLEYANREFFNPESLFNNFEVSGHSLYLDQPMNYEEESVTAQLDDDTLRNVGAPAFNYGYGGFPIPSLPENEDIEYHEEETKWIKKREIEKKQLLMGTVDRLQMEVNKKRSEIEEIIENTEKQTRDDARLLERKSIYFFVEETDAQKKDRKWRSKFLSHFGNVKDLPLDQLMVRLKNALREKKQLQKRRESKEIIKKVEEDIRVAEKFLGRASTYFIAEQELERASREMRSIIQFDNKLKRRLNERDTLWKEIMEKNCVKTTLNHQFTDVLNMEKDTEQWRPSKVVSIPWIFRLAKSSSTAHYQLTVDFKPLVPVASGFIVTVRPTIGTKKLSISKFEYLIFHEFLKRRS